MKQEVLKDMMKNTKELINAPTCNSETKASAEAWLEAVGTDKQDTATKEYIQDLEGDIMPIDNLIGFADSDAGSQYFGADTAKNIAEHAKEIKANGAKYCDCPACAAVAMILEKKEAILST